MEKATEKQVAYLTSLVEETLPKPDREIWESLHGADAASLSKTEASRQIDTVIKYFPIFAKLGICGPDASKSTRETYIAAKKVAVDKVEQGIPWIGVPDKELTDDEYTASVEDAAKDAASRWDSAVAKAAEALA
jgi:hypothetical protein